MKRFIIATAVLAMSSLAYSQSGESVSSSGNIVQVQNINLRWNLGGVANGLMTSGGIQLSNGYYVQQELEALSVQQPKMVLSIAMYPNPTKSEITLVIETDVDIAVTDMNGRQVKVKHLTPSSNSLDLSELTTGTYIVLVSSKDKTNTYKLIKQ